jgi:hypothetical protein
VLRKPDKLISYRQEGREDPKTENSLKRKLADATLYRPMPQGQASDFLNREKPAFALWTDIS